LNYAALAIGSAALGARAGGAIAWTALATVALSILVHGATANALTRRLVVGRRER
jgi:NhaP-type Na+/H+ or K+/H+ antiporter